MKYVILMLAQFISYVAEAGAGVVSIGIGYQPDLPEILQEKQK